MKQICVAAFALLALGACAPERDEGPVAPAAPASAAPIIDLQALSGSDIEGRLNGELACAFTSEGGDLLLIGRGNVQPAEHSAALVRQAGAVEQMDSRVTGGYDAMVDGVTFSNATLSARVEPGARQPEASEQVVHAAMLTVQLGDAQRIYPGTWTCGP